MQVRVIAQSSPGTSPLQRVGDELITSLLDVRHDKFRFAVAYMRMSGWNRLSGATLSLRHRGGSIEGAVGIDDGVTSVEALEELSKVSSRSTVVHTVSNFIYHPKLYLFSGQTHAVVVVGSSNLTSDGLFRNTEIATSIDLDFTNPADVAVYSQFDAVANGLLNPGHPNVAPLNSTLTSQLETAGLVRREAQQLAPGRASAAQGVQAGTSAVAGLFPPLNVRQAPPTSVAAIRAIAAQATITPQPVARQVTASTFIMQLSAFDSSHRSGVPGTPEILVPQGALGFFPTLPTSPRAGRQHPDVEIDVLLNTSGGYQLLGYRFWYYQRRTEWRLNVRHATIDQTTPGGGDLLVIDKLTQATYEATVYSPADPAYARLLSLCTNNAQGKLWGTI